MKTFITSTALGLLAVANLIISCSRENTAITPSSQARFKDLFTPVDSILLTSKDSIKSILSICVDKNQNLILCDYIGQQICKYNVQEKTIDRLNDTINGKKVLANPIAVTTDETGNIYVSSNTNRRILIFDANGKIKKSFLISGGNMTPTRLLVVQNTLYMGGFSLRQRTLIHTYDRNGRYLNNFFEQSRSVAETPFGGTINYPFFDVANNTLWAIQQMDYRLEHFDLSGRLMKDIKFAPDYYLGLTTEIEKKAESSNASNFLNAFSKPICLFSSNGKIFVQVEMPRKEVSSDYLNGAIHVLDIFDSEGEVIFCGVPCGNERLMFVDPGSNVFYFLSRMDYAKRTFAIKSYTFRNPRPVESNPAQKPNASLKAKCRVTNIYISRLKAFCEGKHA
jgi:hypothetical protein